MVRVTCRTGATLRLPEVDHVRAERDQFRRVFTNAIGVASSRAIIDPHIATYGPAQCIQRLLERRVTGYHFRIIICEDLEHADASHLIGWLRTNGERPRHNDPAQKRHELPPPHSITSSARPSSESGTVRPRALAVLRFMISSTFVDCMTGKLAGFSPLRIFPV